MFMVLRHLDPHHFSVWMEPSSSPIEIKSWRDGMNISALFSIILHQSMMRQFNAFCKFQSVVNLMHHPLLEKTQKAISQLSNGKAPMTHVIPAEVYRYSRAVLHQKLVNIFQSIWQHGTVLQDFKDVLTIHLYKRKGNCQQCDNHCSISLLSITGKVLARVLLNHLTTHLEKCFLLESQCGFHTG